MFKVSALALIGGGLLIALDYGIMFTGLGLGFRDHDLLSIRTTIWSLVGLSVVAPGVLLIWDELGLD